jgi:hypothetical protein
MQVHEIGDGIGTIKKSFLHKNQAADDSGLIGPTGMVCFKSPD